MNLEKKLARIKACYAACLWGNAHSEAWAWRNCHRADWMLWLLVRMAGRPGWPTWEDLGRLSCTLAESVMSLVPQRDRPFARRCLEVARAWIAGQQGSSKERERLRKQGNRHQAGEYALRAFCWLLILEDPGHGVEQVARAARAARAAQSYARTPRRHNDHNVHQAQCRLIRLATRKYLPMRRVWTVAKN